MGSFYKRKMIGMVSAGLAQAHALASAGTPLLSRKARRATEAVRLLEHHLVLMAGYGGSTCPLDILLEWALGDHNSLELQG